MTATKTKEQWEDQRNEAWSALYAIEQREIEATNAVLVGRCFSYRNSGGGCGDKSWPLYARVLRIDGMNIITHEFEDRPNGEIHIDTARIHYRQFLSGYQSISDMAYLTAWAELQQRIAAIKFPA